MSDPAFRRDPPPANETPQNEPLLVPKGLTPEVAAALAALFDGKTNHPWGKSRDRKRGTTLV